jgi:hypothetical protein
MDPEDGETLNTVGEGGVTVLPLHHGPQDVGGPPPVNVIPLVYAFAAK